MKALLKDKNDFEQLKEGMIQVEKYLLETNPPEQYPCILTRHDLQKPIYVYVDNAINLIKENYKSTMFELKETHWTCISIRLGSYCFEGCKECDDHSELKKKQREMENILK
jgi:hypothetical protein